MGSALIVGSANDSALDVLLHGKTMEEAKKELRNKMLHPEINGEVLDSLNTNKIKFSKSDLKNAPIDSDVPALVLLAKGEMILDQYAEQIMPKIKNVLGTQLKASIKNEFGDEIFGYADMIVEWEDGRILLLDNKTAAKKYNDEKVEEMMPQLAVYEEAFRDEYKIDDSGFIVQVKDIRKTLRNGPRVTIQEEIFTIPEEMYKKTFDEYDQVLHNIKMGNFESNHPDCNMFYGNCMCSLGRDTGYFESGGTNMTGLIQTERKR